MLGTRHPVTWSGLRLFGRPCGKVPSDQRVAGRPSLRQLAADISIAAGGCTAAVRLNPRKQDVVKRQGAAHARTPAPGEKRQMTCMTDTSDAGLWYALNRLETN